MKSIQIPDEVYARAAELASMENVSVDKLVTAIVSAEVRDSDWLRARAARGSMERFRQILDKVSDAPPDPLDAL
jgi:hypothetical protein